MREHNDHQPWMYGKTKCEWRALKLATVCPLNGDSIWGDLRAWVANREQLSGAALNRMTNLVGAHLAVRGD